ncbi:PTS sugar transporter subunit IIA [Isobaculum melis]|uniref:PTS system, mannose-specific IIA component n=1 Tax=Isobaculum melis TaxID=142588 RepID=A0A1H9TM93_9LACT|nr:PTS fructose transporter subunit IIA [Isobaculum melis]SER98157.1 PTS system, mannose-specific IIA component [Isobaculum melis]
MKKFLVASHGKMASGIQNSVDILTGMGNQIEVIDAYIDEVDYTIKIQQFIETLHVEDTAIIFTDLYGGSVNQKVMVAVAAHPSQNIHVITGMNLAVILSVVLEAGEITTERLQELIDESQVKLVLTESLVAEESEDNFFD